MAFFPPSGTPPSGTPAAQANPWVTVLNTPRETHRVAADAEHKARQVELVLTAIERRAAAVEKVKETNPDLFAKLMHASMSVTHPKPGDNPSKEERVARFESLHRQFEELVDKLLSVKPEEAVVEPKDSDEEKEHEAPRPGRRARRTAARRAASQKEYDERRVAHTAKPREALKPTPKRQTRQKPKPKINECRKCGACFMDKGDLNEHLRTKHPLPPRLTKCDHCDLHVAVADIREHVLKKHPVPEGCVACKMCHLHVKKDAIRKHLATRCQKAIGTCRHCGKKDRRDRIIEHVKVCTSNPKNQCVAGGAGGAGGPGGPGSNSFAHLDSGDK